MKRYYQTFIISLLAITVIALGSVAKDAQAHPQVVTDTVPTSQSSGAIITASTYHSPSQVPSLLEDANELGINVTGIRLAYMDSATPPADSDLPTTDQASGMFDPNTMTIYILRNQSAIEGGSEAEDETSTLAYEYMHYVWMNLDSQDQATEGQALQQYNDQNSHFHGLVDEYVGSQDTLDNEYLATACTEIQPSALANAFNAWCDQYIPNRETVLF